MHIGSNNKELIKKLPLALIAITSVAVLIYCFSDGISGNDFWWHVKVGQWICENGKVPVKDIFSWIGKEKGIRWTAHEWLSDVIFYAVYSVGRDAGIFLMAFVAAVAMQILLWREAKNYVEKNMVVGGLFFCLFPVLLSILFYGRPHVFSCFLLFAALKCLYAFYENPKSKGIYFMPLISCVWSNVHGGSSNLSYILCIAFLLAGLLELEYGRVYAERMDRTSIIKLLIITAATMGAIFINPIGKDVFIYPYKSMGDKLMMYIISEWQSPDAKDLGSLILYFAPIIIMTIGIITEKTRVRLLDLMVMMMFLFLFFRSVRFIIYWYIAAAFYAFRYVPPCKVKEIKTRLEKGTLIAYTCLLVITVIMSMNTVITNYRNNKLISRALQDKMVSVVKEYSPRRLFNDYNVGEALIFNDLEVFFDSRADLFAQENIMADGISLIYLEQVVQGEDKTYVDVEELFGRYRFDSVLILKQRPLYAYLISHPDKYKIIYEDDSAAFFSVKAYNSSGSD